MRNDVGESREADNSRSKSKIVHEVTEICSGLLMGGRQKKR